MLLSRLSLAVVVMLSSCAFAGEAAKLTSHDLAASALRIYQRQLLESYEKDGSRNAKWDAAAKAFLERAALNYANKSFTDWYRLPDDAENAVVLKLADEAIQLGCDDPLVLYSRVFVVEKPTVVDEMREWSSVVQPLLDSSYSPICKYAAARRMANLRLPSNAPAEVRQLQARAAKELPNHLLQYVLSPVSEPLEWRLRYRRVRDTYLGNTAGLQDFVALFSLEANADKWLLNMLQGDLEIDFGWEARGRGLANTVKEEGWRGLAEHMAQARVNFTSAYEINPAFPEAANRMITVCLGESAGLRETRGWFEKSIAAQIDYMEAWESMSHSLQPRWGGSHLARYQLAAEAARTARYDTQLPSFLFLSLRRISDDNVGAKLGDKVYRLFFTWRDIETALDGYLANPKLAEMMPYLHSQKAALAYHCGRYELAQTILSANKAVVEAAFAEVNLRSADVRSVCAAVLSDKKLPVLQALKLDEQGNHSEALTAWSKLATEVPADHAARPLILKHKVLNEAATALEQDKPVSFAIHDAEKRIAWDIDGANWKFGNGEAVITHPGSMVFAKPMPQDRETTVEFRFDGHRRDPAQFDVWLQHVDGDRIIGCSVQPNAGEIRITSRHNRYAEPARQVVMETDTWNTLTIRQVGKSIEVALNGTIVLPRQTSSWLVEGKPIVGLASFQLPLDNNTLTLRNLTVKPIQNAPQQ